MAVWMGIVDALNMKWMMMREGSEGKYVHIFGNFPYWKFIGMQKVTYTCIMPQEYKPFVTKVIDCICDIVCWFSHIVSKVEGSCALINMQIELLNQSWVVNKRKSADSYLLVSENYQTSSSKFGRLTLKNAVRWH